MEELNIKDIDTKIQIKEFKNGKFQVWKGDRAVLRPKVNSWEGSHYKNHEFMFFDSLQEALIAADQTTKKKL